MPTQITHVLPCGALYEFTEYRIEDLIDTGYIVENVSRETLAFYKDPYSVGRKLHKMAHVVGVTVVRDSLAYIVGRLLEGDRYMTPYTRQMYIGVLPKNRTTTSTKKRRIPPDKKLPPPKQVFGIIVEGMDQNYYFRMPGRRRKELAKRIQAGQWYPGKRELL
jgi:hypothetical protein